MAAVLGVDGCPGGWVGALVDDSLEIAWHCGTFAELLQLPADVVAVDIPIGLPAGGVRRRADVLARARPGMPASSVFSAPHREVLAALDHPEASRLSRAAGGVGVSLQTYNIVPKIREVDRLLARDPSLHGRVVEVHPEVSFRLLSGGRPLDRKLGPSGRAARLALLAGWLPDPALPRPRPGRSKPDDCLDALACAWTGWRWRRGEAEVLGGERDAAGHPMRIVA